MIMPMRQKKWRLIKLYSLVSIATNIFDVIVTLMFFDNLLTWKKIQPYKKLLIGVFMFTATLLNNIFIQNKVFTIIISIMVLLIVSSGFNGSIKKKILTVIGYMILVIIADVLVTLLAIQFFDANVNTLLNIQSNARMINKIISKPIFLLLVRIAFMFTKKDNFKIYRNCNIALLTIPVANIALMISMIDFFNYIDIKTLAPIYFALLCILYNTILVFYLFERVMGMALLQNKYNILENQIVIQAENVKHDEEYNNKIKAFRHDMKLHFQTLYHMIVNEYFERAKKYLEDTNLVEKIVNCRVHTGNIAFDAIINAKLSEAEYEGINTRIVCQIPSDIEMDDIDICILFGNLLDNAIEGCQRVEKGDKEINIYIKYNRNRLSCCIKNTSLSDLKKEGDSFVSLKTGKNEHGVGLYNIKNVVLKYEGICKMINENGYFQTNITLFI